MQALCPEYGTTWRWLDLQFLWLWGEALRPLDHDVRHEIVTLLLWIVRQRLLQLWLAQRLGSHGVMSYETWWRRYRASSPLALCASTHTVKDMKTFTYRMGQETDIRVIGSSIHSREHETLRLRVDGDEVPLIVHVAEPCWSYLQCAQLELDTETLWCSFTEHERQWGEYTVHTHRVPLLQL